MEARDYVVRLRVMGLSQQDIADKTGIKQPSISKIESGVVTDIMSRSYRALQKLHDSMLAQGKRKKA